MSLGTYPDTSLAQARENRDAARKLLAKSIDPSQQRKADKRAEVLRDANSFAAVALEWHGKQVGGATLALVPTPRRRKAQLDRLEGVRVEMSRVYRDMESGRRDSQDGSRLVYVLTQIAKVLELTEIERRLTTLEGTTSRRA